jgi:site-specific DNA recombinase
MVKQAVIYARVSTDEQGKGYSLATQIEACQVYADECEYKVSAIFSDEYTGASLDRPALDELRDFIARSPVEIIIVYDLDRLARKSAYQVLIEEEFKRLGAVIEFVMAQYDDSDEGRLQKQIRSVIAEYEKAKILERSKRGKRGKAKSGFVIPGARPPYGYTVKSEPHKAWFEIDEEEAGIVQLCFDWYINGDEQGKSMSINGIAKRLTKMGILTRGDKLEHVAKKFGKGIWQPATIVHILKNETYTGTWYYGKTRMMDDGKQREARPKCGLGKQVARPREEWIPVNVPPIIDHESFALAQERFKYNKQMLSGHSKNEYLMKSRVTCAKCGYSMIGRTRRKRHKYYVCKGKDQIVCLCDMPYFRADWVDSLVWEWVKVIIQNPEYLREGLEQSQAQLQSENRALFDRMAIIETQTIEYQGQLDKLLDLYLGGDFPKVALMERKTRLEQMLDNLRKEQADLLAHIRKVAITDDQLTYIEAFCAKIQDGLDKADLYAKRKILELLDIHAKVAIESDEKVIYLKCLLGQQRVSLHPTSHSSNTGGIVITRCAFLPTAPSR